jgi:DNA-binding Lrp family transcriptional regulator
LSNHAIYTWKNIANTLGISVSKAKALRRDLLRAGVIFYTYMGRPPRKVVGAFPPLLRLCITKRSVTIPHVPLYGWRIIARLFQFSERKMRSYRRELRKEGVIHYAKHRNPSTKTVCAYSSDLMIWATKKSKRGEIFRTLQPGMTA